LGSPLPHSMVPTRRSIAVAVVFCVLVVCYLLHRDYAWQMILLLRVLPPTRDRCGPPLTRSPANTFSDHALHLRSPLKVGILMLFDEAMLAQEMTQLSILNKKQYAARHGYELIVVHGADVDTNRPPAWSKFLAMQRHLPRFNFLLFMDIDTLIMNDEVRLEELAQVNGNGEKDLIISEDWNGVNSGVFMLRNSTWSKWFLAEAFGSKGSEPEYMATHERSREGVKYPFEYEQRAIHYLLQTSVWKSRGLPAFEPSTTSIPPPGASDPWDHLRLMPQCAMNSYMLYPRLESILGLKVPSAYTAAQFVPGDFVVHMAGHKDANKQDLFRYCYDLSKKEGEGGRDAAMGAVSKRRLREHKPKEVSRRRFSDHGPF